MGAWAFALPTTVSPVTVTTFDVFYTVVLSDGVSITDDLGVDFIWDTTQSVAVNIANAKTTIANLAASQQGIQLLSTQVSIFSAVD